MISFPTQNFETTDAGFAAVTQQTDTEPTPIDPEETIRRRDARALCVAVRLAVPEILSHAKHGAMRRRDGREWAHDLDRFEALSMEQAKTLAAFPIDTSHPEFGVLVHRTRASFVAFRELVRREIVGKVDAATDTATLDRMIEHVANRAALAVRSLLSLESALAE